MRFKSPKERFKITKFYRRIEYDGTVNSSVVEEIKIILLLVVSRRIAHAIIVIYNFTWSRATLF